MNTLYAAFAPDLASTRTVNETLQSYPVTAPVFNAFGIDSCCGGQRTLLVAAKEAGISAEQLLAALYERVQLSQQMPVDVPAGRAVRECACGCRSSNDTAAG